jgi:hypothetical protein
MQVLWFNALLWCGRCKKHPRPVARKVQAATWLRTKDLQERVTLVSRCALVEEFLTGGPRRSERTLHERQCAVIEGVLVIAGMLNEDPMATEKLAEGIRKFSADLESRDAKLKDLL